ncbi:DNA mismatch repair protein MutS [Acrasis kona]|uniref:DNA mismatch repair protein MutS n=1 Tax=Acrasis kona TaxID=1008807 RepID=A0AAW2ZPR2_9EUKA
MDDHHGNDSSDDDMDIVDDYRMVLSVTLQQGKLGVAYFNKSTSEMGWGETNDSEASQFQSLEFISNSPLTCSQVQTKANTDIGTIQTRSKLHELDECPNFEVKILRLQDYSFESSKNKLHTLSDLINDTGNNDSEQRVQGNLWGISAVDFDSHKQMIRAAGGILHFIQSNRMQFGEMDEEKVLSCIKSVKFLSFEGFLQIDMNAIRSLSVFKSEKHPCQTMRIGVSKEGLSLFGILNKTKSSVGRETLRQWLLQPLMDIESLNERFDSIEYFSNVNNKHMLSEIRDNLKFIKDTRKMIKRIRESKSNMSDWLNLYKTIYCFNTIVESCHKERTCHQVPIVVKLFENFNDVIMNVLTTMSKVIDFRESKSANRIVILPDVDQELDNLKNVSNGLDHLLNLVAEEEQQLLPDNIDISIGIVYFPQIGYLISIPNQNGTITDHNVQGLLFHFASNETSYYKNERMFELDEKIGDVHTEIVVYYDD